MKRFPHWKDMTRLGIVGAGSWGTALGAHLAGKGLQVDIWAYEEEVVRQIRDHKENRMYLPGVILPPGLHPTADMEAVVKNQAVVLMVVPSHIMRSILRLLPGFLAPGVILVGASKGIENESLMTMSQVMDDVLPGDLAVYKACLSGPSFAREVGMKLPTAVTLACPEVEAAALLQNLFYSPTMRVYSTKDMIGVELGGALKNIYAIGAGIADGLGLGTNARAALITRGLAEMSRLGVKMGANPLTFMGLAGIGDLVLTCTGDLSRNRTVGLNLGRGRKLTEILSEMNMVAEGVKTTKSVHDLAERENVDMPLSGQVYQVLYRDKSPRLALTDLMTRDLKDEIDRELMI